MTNEELVLELKKLLFTETIEEIECLNDAFNLGVMDNKSLLSSLQNLISYYKDEL